jgi:hypothetical protein
MTDHQLSTRDLAARSDSDEVDGSPENERASDRTPGAIGDQDAGFDNSETDPSLMREPDAGQPAGTGAAESGTNAAGADHEPLFASDQSERFTGRWHEIQTSFVDQPRDAVAEADALVADLMQRLAASFSQERERLEAQWDRGDDVSTEDLRVALTRYRSFFDRLLSA